MEKAKRKPHAAAKELNYELLFPLALSFVELCGFVRKNITNVNSQGIVRWTQGWEN